MNKDRLAELRELLDNHSIDTILEELIAEVESRHVDLTEEMHELNREVIKLNTELIKEIRKNKELTLLIDKLDREAGRFK